MSNESHKPLRRRWWRVLRRLALAGVIAGLIGALALGGAAWWAFGHRVELANKALDSMAGPVNGSVESLDVKRSGDFELRGLRLKDKTSNATVLHLPRVTGKLDWSALPSRIVPQLTLHEPEVLLDEATIAGWLQAKPGATGSSVPSTPPAFRLEKLDIRDARVRIQRQGNTSTDVVINYRSDFIALGSDGQFSMGDEELTIAESGNGDAAKALPYGLHRLHVKGRLHDGIVDLDELALDRPSVHLTPELFATLGIRPAPQGAAATDGTNAGTPVAQPLLRRVRIGRVTISDFAFATSGFAAGNTSGLLLPEVKVLTPGYEAGGIEWQPGSPTRIGRQALHWRNLDISAAEDEGHIRCEEVQLALRAWEMGGAMTVESLHLSNPDVRWTPALRRLFAQDGSAPPTTAPSNVAPPVPPINTANPDHAPPESWSLTIASAAITGAKVHLADPDLMDFELQVGGGFMLADLMFDEHGWHSQSFQSLELTSGHLTFPSDPGEAAKKPFLELALGELVMKPDDWNKDMRVAKLSLEKPVVRLRDGNTPWMESGEKREVRGEKSEVKDSKSAEPPPTSHVSPLTSDAPPWWKRIHFGQLSVTDGFIDMLVDAPKPVDMQAHLNIATERLADVGSLHRVRIGDFSAKLPTLSPLPFPVAQAGELEGAVRLPEMWREHRIEELRLTGAAVDFGEPLLKLFEPERVAAAPSPPPKQDEPAPAEAPAGGEEHKAQSTNSKQQNPWRAGLLSVQQSAMTISNLVPGLPTVKFGVSFEVEDTPLLAEDLVDDIAPQRIELHDLKIPSPNGTARYVAELDSIFVDFSLEGLMRKEIEGVEIVSPTLFVGEDLFWYVDFYRKYAEHGSQPARNGPQVAANDGALDLELSRAALKHEPPVSEASWSVKRLQVHSGKLVLAPKGTPMKGFKHPFPFHLDTEVKRGTLNAEMEVPPDTYELPDLNLQFVGMKGAVQFNLPIKQKDNNLVETFEVDSIRWKELKTGKAFLSVTYDALGIYAKFGAEAYEGYLNGAVNVYLDDSYHWDGWLGGKNLQTHKLTRILCPLYFIMDGRVEATLVAQGSKDELYQADGSFKNHTPGRFSISALNGLINDLPKDWDPLKAQLSKIGLETLRDFNYDHAEMKCRFYGREGNGMFKFTGPDGSRNFEVNVYDHRWKTDDEIRMTKSE